MVKILYTNVGIATIKCYNTCIIRSVVGLQFEKFSLILLVKGIIRGVMDRNTSNRLSSVKL